MNYKKIWAVPLILAIVGCQTVPVASKAPVSPLPSVASIATATPSASPSEPNLKANESESSQSEINQETNQSESVTQTANEPQRDYGATSPLPGTGKVTIRNDIRNLDPNLLIADCPADSAPYAFAESTNYRVQICSQEYDPWQPKYYIGQAKDGQGELRITSSDPNEARQLIFQNEGYTYILYRDSARPEQNNAYLEIYSPNGEGRAEALLYLYTATNPN